MPAEPLGVAAATSRFGGEDVVEAGYFAFDHHLGAGDDLAALVARQDVVARHRRGGDPLGVRAPLQRRRAARQADPLGELVGVGGCRSAPQPAARQRSSRRTGRARRATMTRVSSMRSMPRAARWRSSPAGSENGVMRTNGAQAGGGEERQAERQLLVDAEPSRSDRLDAARALGLAGRESHQPAVDPALLARRAGVDASVLDPRQQRVVDRRDGRRGGHHCSGVQCQVSARATISRAKSRKASAPLDAGSKTTPGMP